MIGWLLAGLGTALMAGGTAITTAAATVRRVDLYRWVTLGRPGAAAAGTLLAAPGRLMRAAAALGTVGAALVGSGAMALLAPLTPAGALAILVVVGVPVILMGAYTVPRLLAQPSATALVRTMVPWLSRVAPLLAPLGPPQIAQHGGEAPEGDDQLTVLAGVVAFTERPVREIMTPRTEIVAVREGASLEQIAQVFADSGYSRLPVFRESLDDIVGIIYAFDILKIAPGAELPVRPVITTPAVKRCSDLLAEMQKERRYFAVVLDEYGGTAGIATLEDVLEELVGEIFDEYDVQAPVEAPGTELLEATGATPVDDLRVRFDADLPRHAETIGGLLAHAAGQIPRTGERYILGGLEFDVLQATPNRVERVVVRRLPVPVRHLS